MVALLISLFVFSGLGIDNLDTIRLDYHQIDSKESLEVFLEQLEAINDSNSIPYLASAYMQKAKYVVSPYSKLKYFNKGKDMLEEFITHNPNNIDARYVRCLVQNNVPGFLGYSDNIRQDKHFVIEHIENSNVKEDVKVMMMKNIKSIENK